MAILALAKFLWDWVSWFFSPEDAGHLVAITNCMILFWVLCIAAAYIFKSWGLRTWNRNTMRNKQRHRRLHFGKMSRELAAVDEDVTHRRKYIVDLSFKELRESLQEEKILAREAVEAFMWKALEVQEKYNCVTEFLSEAVESAERLDSDWKGRSPKPPLFGLPFSVKDNFWLKGYECSRGLAGQLGKEMPETCSFVEHLTSLGAVPILRSTVPQTLLQYVCTSPTFGTTLNPHDVSRSPGGSSGGEAVCVSAGAVSFGIGSDLLGSLRIPAQFCGLCTLKPTAGRLVITGAHGGVPGVSRLALSNGFFTNDVATQEFLLDNFLRDYNSKVPLSVPMPLAMKDQKKQLKIGFFDDDGWLTPVPSSRRAVHFAKEILQLQGHELIEFQVPRPTEMFKIMFKCFQMDNGDFVRTQLKHEDVHPLMKPTKMLLRLPTRLRGLLSLLVRPFWPKVSTLAGAIVHSLSDLRETYEKADEYVLEFTRLWQSLELDALVCPAFPFPAIPHQYPSKLMAAGASTGLFNLLDFPAGVLPITRVTAEDVKELLESYPSPSAVQSSHFSLKYPVEAMIRAANVGSEGLPVGVQVVALPFREEMCLHVMKQLEDRWEDGTLKHQL